MASSSTRMQLRSHSSALGSAPTSNREPSGYTSSYPYSSHQYSYYTNSSSPSQQYYAPSVSSYGGPQQDSISRLSRGATLFGTAPSMASQSSARRSSTPGVGPTPSRSPLASSYNIPPVSSLRVVMPAADSYESQRDINRATTSSSFTPTLRSSPPRDTYVTSGAHDSLLQAASSSSRSRQDLPTAYSPPGSTYSYGYGSITTTLAPATKNPLEAALPSTTSGSKLAQFTVGQNHPASTAQVTSGGALYRSTGTGSVSRGECYGLSAASSAPQPRELTTAPPSMATQLQQAPAHPQVIGPQVPPIPISDPKIYNSLLVTPQGLPNQGNTCYMNAVLQCVIHNRHLLLNLKRFALMITNLKVPLSEDMIELGAKDRETSRSTLIQSIKGIVGQRNSEFLGYEQADSHEFLRTLLLAVHDEVNRHRNATRAYEELKDIPGEAEEEVARRWLAYHKKRDDSCVYDIFGGVIKAVTQCDRCGVRSYAFDPFLDLSLALPRGAIRTDEFQLITLYQNFLEEERIDASQEWKCSGCKRQSTAVRSQSIYTYPQTLVIHLKRFNSRGVKNEARVLYTDRMSMGGYRYYLSAVVCHSGTSMFGHYTSYVKGRDEKWYQCNDSDVVEVKQSAHVMDHPCAYILFYDLR